MRQLQFELREGGRRGTREGEVPVTRVQRAADRDCINISEESSSQAGVRVAVCGIFDRGLGDPASPSSTQAEAEAAAALKIQSTFRGHQARTQIANVRL